MPLSGMDQVLVEDGGVDEVDLALRVRHLIAGGVRRKGPRGPRTGIVPPRDEAVHVVAVLLSTLDLGPQLRTVGAVRRLWQAKRILIDGPGADQTPATFGPYLVDLLERAARGLLGAEVHAGAGLREFMDGIRMIGVQQGFAAFVEHGPSAEHPDGRSVHFALAGWRNDAAAHPAARRTVQAFPGRIFIPLARELLLARRQAERLGVVIDTSEALEALNRDDFDELDGPSGPQSGQGETLLDTEVSEGSAVAQAPENLKAERAPPRSAFDSQYPSRNPAMEHSMPLPYNRAVRGYAIAESHGGRSNSERPRPHDPGPYSAHESAICA